MRLNGFHAIGIAVGAAAIVWGSMSLGESSTFTLYRNSVFGANARIHVATFDAHEEDGYNNTNCNLARDLFQDQPAVLVRYWCEKGRFRK